MKAFLPILVLALGVGLSACGSNAAATPIPTVILGPSSPGDSTSLPGTAVSASAEVVPLVKVNLSFPLVGTVETVNVEVGDTVSAGDSLVMLDTLILQARVAEAEAGVAAAETQVRYLTRVGPGAEQLDAARAEVERTEAAAEQARAVLEQATLRAPIGGTVVAVEIAAGETVVPGQIVIVIGDLTHMRIETTDLSEQDVPSVQVGQRAMVFIDALNQDFAGEVTEIAGSSETIGGDVVYKVTIELDEQPDGLRWGMSAEVEIETDQ